MAGRDYVEVIREELLKGRPQRRKGSSLLAAFGYVRRRQTVLDEISKELKRLSLRTEPRIDNEMPLETQIHFILDQEGTTNTAQAPVTTDDAEPAKAPENGPTDVLPVAGFKVGELSAAHKDVEYVKPTETVLKAYTVMGLKKYSQLVVAETRRPLAIAIKGTISYQSIANAILHGSAELVKDCLDVTTPQVQVDADIGAVIEYLSQHDVVLVIGSDKRLSGIITAWDLADEFAKLVGPFKWIGEIEWSVKRCLEDKLGRDAILAFLNADRSEPGAVEIEGLTIGELLRVVQDPENWERLRLPYDRVVFITAFDRVRKFRNRLAHFGDPLEPEEMALIGRFRDLVRMIR